MNRLHRHLPREEAESFTELIVGALRKVYDTNAGRHDELLGDDPLTFGVLNWRNGWHAIEESLEEFPNARTSRPRGSLLVEVGPLSFRFYSAPGDETDDISTYGFDEGSITKRDLPIKNQLKLDLEWPSDEERLASLTELAVVHTGNPIDGLCAVWIGAPRVVGDTSSSAWAWVDPVWLIDRSQTEASSGALDQRSHIELEVPILNIGFIEESDEGNEADESDLA